MEKEKYLNRILIVIVVFVVGYYFVNVILSPVRLPTSEKSTVMSAKTGEPLSQEEVKATTQRQAKVRVAYTLTGKVTAKIRDSLQVETSTDGETRSLQLRFSPKMVFLEEVPLGEYGKNSSDTEEREISPAKVKIGDSITVVFPKGIMLDTLNKTEMIEINNLIVNMSQKEAVAKD